MFPTHHSNDYDKEIVNEVDSILLKPISQIPSCLIALLNNKRKAVLICILRAILENPFAENHVFILGWFIVNSFVPNLTLFVFFTRLQAEIAKKCFIDYSIQLAECILPQIHKYPLFCKSLLGIENLELLKPELYIVIEQISNMESVHFDVQDMKNHFLLPKERPSYPPVEPSPPTPEFVPLSAENGVRNNLYISIQHAITLKPEEQRTMCATICLRFSPPSQVISLPQLLPAACDYVKWLLNNTKNAGWPLFDYHSNLSTMGSWIAFLSISTGRPPPVYMLDVPRLLRESVVNGVFGHAMVFLFFYFQKILIQYAPPCPYTVSVLEIVSAVSKVPGIRTDVLGYIDSFMQMLKTNKDFYYRRSIDVPIGSFDRHAVFISEPSTGNCVFSTQLPDSIVLETKSVLPGYFNYSPIIDLFVPIVKEIANKSSYYEKYFLVGSPVKYCFSNKRSSSDDLIRCLVSLALSSSLVLSSVATKLFLKVTKFGEQHKLCRLFRYIFPNPVIFFACIKRNLFFPESLNALFFDLLTNPETQIVSKEKILRYAAMLPRDNRAFIPLFKILDFPFISKQKDPIFNDIDNNDDVVKSIIGICHKYNAETIKGFNYSFGNCLPEKMFTIISIMCKSANSQHIADSNMYRTDYSVIDFIVWVFTHIPDRPFSDDTLLTSLREAILMIDPFSFSTKKLSRTVFRFIFVLFNDVNPQNKQLIANLLSSLSPINYPCFTCCWINLCLHQKVFPVFSQSNDPVLLQFCLNYVLICLHIAQKEPHLYYRIVCRVLYLIQSSNSSFFSTYFPLLIESLPLCFIQFRNIILNSFQNTSDIPQIGFNFSDILESKALTANLRSLLNSSNTDSASGINFVIATLTRECTENITKNKIMWRVVYYCLNTFIEANRNNTKALEMTSKNPCFLLFNTLLNAFDTEISALLIRFLIDHLRFPSYFTTLASSLLYELFSQFSGKMHEIIFVELARRLLCVERPPESVHNLFTKILNNHGQKLHEYMESHHQLDVFLEVTKAI